MIYKSRVQLSKKYMKIFQKEISRPFFSLWPKGHSLFNNFLQQWPVFFKNLYVIFLLTMIKNLNTRIFYNVKELLGYSTVPYKTPESIVDLTLKRSKIILGHH